MKFNIQSSSFQGKLENTLVIQKARTYSKVADYYDFNKHNPDNNMVDDSKPKYERLISTEILEKLKCNEDSSSCSQWIEFDITEIC